MNEDTIQSGWFSIRGAAKYTGFTESVIDDAIMKGKISSYPVVTDSISTGPDVRVCRADLDAWISGSRVTKPAEDETILAEAVRIIRWELKLLRRDLLSRFDSRPRWLTRKGAAAYSGLSIGTIDRATRAESIVRKHVGRTPLIDRQTLDAWIESGGAEEGP